MLRKTLQAFPISHPTATCTMLFFNIMSKTTHQPMRDYAPNQPQHCPEYTFGPTRLVQYT